MLAARLENTISGCICVIESLDVDKCNATCVFDWDV